jgi:hypothetical protein
MKKWNITLLFVIYAGIWFVGVSAMDKKAIEIRLSEDKRGGLTIEEQKDFIRKSFEGDFGEGATGKSVCISEEDDFKTINFFWNPLEKDINGIIRTVKQEKRTNFVKKINFKNVRHLDKERIKLLGVFPNLHEIHILCDEIDNNAFERLPKSVCLVSLKFTNDYQPDTQISLPEKNWLEYVPSPGVRGWVKRSYLKKRVKNYKANHKH